MMAASNHVLKFPDFILKIILQRNNALSIQLTSKQTGLISETQYNATNIKTLGIINDVKELYSYILSLRNNEDAIRIENGGTLIIKFQKQSKKVKHMRIQTKPRNMTDQQKLQSLNDIIKMQIEDYKQKLNDQQKQIEQQDKYLNNLSKQFQTKQKQIKELKENIEMKMKINQQLHQEIQNIDENNEFLDEKITNLEKEIQKQKIAITQYQRKLQVQQNDTDREKFDHTNSNQHQTQYVSNNSTKQAQDIFKIFAIPYQIENSTKLYENQSIKASKLEQLKEKQSNEMNNLKQKNYKEENIQFKEYLKKKKPKTLEKIPEANQESSGVDTPILKAFSKHNQSDSQQSENQSQELIIEIQTSLKNQMSIQTAPPNRPKSIINNGKKAKIEKSEPKIVISCQNKIFQKEQINFNGQFDINEPLSEFQKSFLDSQQYKKQEQPVSNFKQHFIALQEEQKSKPEQLQSPVCNNKNNDKQLNSMLSHRVSEKNNEIMESLVLEKRVSQNYREKQDWVQYISQNLLYNGNTKKTDQPIKSGYSLTIPNGNRNNTNNFQITVDNSQNNFSGYKISAGQTIAQNYSNLDVQNLFKDLRSQIKINNFKNIQQFLQNNQTITNQNSQIFLKIPQTVIFNKKDMTLTKAGRNKYQQIILRNLVSQTEKVSVKIVRSQSRQVLFGILSEDGLSFNSTCLSKYSIYYSCWDGSIFKQGRRMSQKDTVTQNDVLSMSFSYNLIQWFKNDKFLGSVEYDWRNANKYIKIQMGYIGDVVKI